VLSALTAPLAIAAALVVAAVRLLCGLGLSLQLRRALHALVQGVEAGLFYSIH